MRRSAERDFLKRVAEDARDASRPERGRRHERRQLDAGVRGIWHFAFFVVLVLVAGGLADLLGWI